MLHCMQHVRMCNDKSTDCPNWARDGECAENADFMAQNCPLSCGICSFNCTDTSESCRAWAAEGQCSENPLAMYKDCPIACGVCTPGLL